MAGKDDKYWGGHYGPMMSNATVRVKRQTKPNPGDAFNDIVHEESATALAQHQAARDKLIAAVIAEHGHLLTDSDVTAEDVTASSSDAMQAHHQPVRPRRARKKKKKREIRVFVSSTFRDFKAEREELIKKTFREVKVAGVNRRRRHAVCLHSLLIHQALLCTSYSRVAWQINKACKDRGVFFTYVDLRWGITEEQTTKGETISICLQEVLYNLYTYVDSKH